MTDIVTRHYDTLLAAHYTWMFGMPFTAKVAEQRDMLAGLGVAPGDHGTAIDLGCGPGFQSIALAELGFDRVVAIDTSATLLQELDAHKGDLPIETVRADMRDFDRRVPAGSAEAIVCMGDTLTHLASRADVSDVLAKARDALQPGGVLILTFRDLSAELTGLDRFLPVHADADRIMTCMLEYEPETVVVNDLVHVREGERWTLRKSSYRKLRLSPAALVAELAGLGLAIRHNAPWGRMHAIVAAR
ncbi:MAG: class I SAM-dependent methyltransferase [Pseudomonadota bacterium]|jgi:SAM-dependent methyltransferase